MKLANVALLYVIRLRARLGQELLALVGIAAGVSLVFAALVANTSVTGSAQRLAAGVFGTASYQLDARGGETFDEGMVQRARALPGVAAAAATFEARGEASGPRGQQSIELIGVDPGFARLGGTITRKFSAGYLAHQRAVAMPARLAESTGVALGQTLRLVLSGHTVDAPLGAKLDASDIGDLGDAPLVLAPLAYAQELSGAAGRVTRVFALPDRGRGAQVEQELRRLAAGRANVRPADYDAELVAQAAEPTSQSTALFSVFAALVGFLFAFSAVLLTVPERLRLVADLDEEGYGPGTAVKLLLFDALLLGVAASILGVVLGDQLSRRLFDDTPSFLTLAFPIGSERIVTVSSVVIAGVGGIAASCVAVLGPTAPAVFRARRSQEADPERRRFDRAPHGTWLVGGGVACLAAGVAIVAATPGSVAVAVLGLGLLAGATLLLLPSLLRLIVAVLDGLTRRLRGVASFIAISDLRDPTARRRSLAVAATGAIAIFGSVALQGAHADLQRGLDRVSHDLASIGAVWIVAPGTANLLATTSFSVPANLTQPAGIAGFALYRSGFLDVGNRRVWVIGSPMSSSRPIPLGQIVAGDEQLVTSRLRRGGWTVVSSAVARMLGLRPGDEFTLPSPNPTVFRVAATSTNMGWPPGAIVLNATDYARAWGQPTTVVSSVNAMLAPGVSADRARASLQRALGPSSGLVVQTAAERERNQRAASREGLTRLTEIAALVLVAAVIAMAAAMAGLIWQRRRFFVAMKVEGYSTTDLWRSLLLEAAVLIGAGCALGAAGGSSGRTS